MLGNFGVFSLFAILKTNLFSNHLSKCNFTLNFDLKRLERMFFKHHHIIFMIYIIRLIYCNTLKFQDKPSLRTGQKSALQHSLLRCCANSSKLMPTIHTFMASTFQGEYCQCFTFKICNKIHTKMY